uniref:Uncharacterized protein n=1 Tax=Oryza nivara TaxID=4536 RepID=A0A679BDF9_ORYNI|nr:hypothetical protein [Oryza sativa f. spontanea]
MAAMLCHSPPRRPAPWQPAGDRRSLAAPFPCRRRVALGQPCRARRVSPLLPLGQEEEGDGGRRRPAEPLTGRALSLLFPKKINSVEKEKEFWVPPVGH